LANMRKESSANKVTFSPAMDKSPVLKGKQSKLPDQIQAAILKKKGKKKEGSVDFVSGLSQASGILYTDLYAKRGLEKQAVLLPLAKALIPTTQGIFRTGAKSGGVGALAGAGKRLRDLELLMAKGPEGVLARRELGKANRARLAGEAAAKAEGKAYIPKALDESAESAEFLRKRRALKGTKFQDAPMEYLSAYSPVARAALESGGAAALAGTAGKTLSNLHKQRKLVETAKSVAVPAALGLGGYALLSD